MKQSPEKGLWFKIKDFITNPKVVFFFLVCVFFLNLFDAGVSWWVISTGYAYELNPIMAYLMSISFPLFFATKATIGAILYRICRPKLNEKPVAITVFILFVVYGLLGIYNCYGLAVTLSQMFGILTV